MRDKLGTEDLRLVVLSNFREFGVMVDEHLKEFRGSEESYTVSITESRFSNGEGKVRLNQTIRSKDVYILSDIGNHSVTYNMFGYTNHMGPDEHFQDIKRVISAIRGHADSITVIMPLLYASRQHRRKGRESLDCAVALQELEKLGVSNIITFDAHDPNIQNAIPCLSFENFYPTHTILERFIENEDLGQEDLLVISPDTGAMDRAIYYANMLGSDVGLFYKRRDLSQVVDGRNPIIAHEYMGKDVEGKNIIVVDDMIASGDSMLDIAKELTARKANNIFLVSTFSLLTSGTKKFKEAYEKGWFSKLYSTNLTYVPDEIRNEEWFEEVDCSKYLAKIINTLNNRGSVTPLLNGKEEILTKLRASRGK